MPRAKARQRKFAKAKKSAKHQAKSRKSSANRRTRSPRTVSSSPPVKVGKPIRRAPKKLAPLERDPQAVKSYEAALKSFNQQEFSKARETFQKIIENFPTEKDIVARARAHISMCVQRMARSTPGPKTAEDYYNLAIAHLNRREFDSARTAFEKALSMEPRGDHIFYGLAALESMQGQTSEALKHLQKAIQLNALNRVSAGRDPDFESLAKNPEFESLLHQESAAS
ncbi:MAG: tetratricopeptide repeat protein [Acidobacteriia bacterium]|nr:tetratricopeptide repeat protein [Terriglobia bacterium]